MGEKAFHPVKAALRAQAEVLDPDLYLAMDPSNTTVTLLGEDAFHPVKAALRAQAQALDPDLYLAMDSSSNTTVTVIGIVKR